MLCERLVKMVLLQAADPGALLEDYSDIMHHGRRLQVRP
jgi:hypothetical protein